MESGLIFPPRPFVPLMFPPAEPIMVKSEVPSDEAVLSAAYEEWRSIVSKKKKGKDPTERTLSEDKVISKITTTDPNVALTVVANVLAFLQNPRVRALEGDELADWYRGWRRIVKGHKVLRTALPAVDRIDPVIAKLPEKTKAVVVRDLYRYYGKIESELYVDGALFKVARYRAKEFMDPSRDEARWMRLRKKEIRNPFDSAKRVLEAFEFTKVFETRQFSVEAAGEDKERAAAAAATARVQGKRLKKWMDSKTDQERVQKAMERYESRVAPHNSNVRRVLEAYAKAVTKGVRGRGRSDYSGIEKMGNPDWVPVFLVIDNPDVRVPEGEDPFAIVEGKKVNLPATKRVALVISRKRKSDERSMAEDADRKKKVAEGAKVLSLDDFSAPAFYVSKFRAGANKFSRKNQLPGFVLEQLVFRTPKTDPKGRLSSALNEYAGGYFLKKYDDATQSMDMWHVVDVAVPVFAKGEWTSHLGSAEVDAFFAEPTRLPSMEVAILVVSDPGGRGLPEGKDGAWFVYRPGPEKFAKRVDAKPGIPLGIDTRDLLDEITPSKWSFEPRKAESLTPNISTPSRKDMEIVAVFALARPIARRRAVGRVGELGYEFLTPEGATVTPGFTPSFTPLERAKEYAEIPTPTPTRRLSPEAPVALVPSRRFGYSALPPERRPEKAREYEALPEPRAPDPRPLEPEDPYFGLPVAPVATRPRSKTMAEVAEEEEERILDLIDVKALEEALETAEPEEVFEKGAEEDDGSDEDQLDVEAGRRRPLF